MRVMTLIPLPGWHAANSSGVFNFDLQTTLGDSSVTIDLTLNPAYDISYNAAICAGESYTMPDGSAITAAGPYTSVLQTLRMRQQHHGSVDREPTARALQQR